MLKSKKSKTIIIIIVAIFIGMQAFRPNIKAETKTSNLNLPTDVANIIRKGCYDCHSNETNLRWYDQIQPAFSLVANHIMEGRKALNFSY
ncbi:MAG: cytochrome P460, partial [Pseudopedobacter saltans]